MSINQQKRLRALRGAVTVGSNDRDAIVTATEELLGEMISRNAVDGDDLVSMIFTATPDLDAEFPALAARRLGLAHVPLLCSVELDVTGAMPRCIRVLVHLYSDRAVADLQHVYLREARELRADLHEGDDVDNPKGPL
jgi:chorismate mutase